MCIFTLGKLWRVVVKNQGLGDFLGGPVVESLANARDIGSIPGRETKIPTCHN